jgi:hypothetical protein
MDSSPVSAFLAFLSLPKFRLNRPVSVTAKIVGAPELRSDAEDDLDHARPDHGIMAIHGAPSPFSFQPTFIADDPFDCRNLCLNKFGFGTHVLVEAL